MQSVSNQLNIKLGIEMIAAYKSAVQIHSKVILGDRPIDITLNRLWYSLSWFQKLKLIANIFYECTQQITAQDIESLKQSDLLTEILEELSENYPQLSKVLVDGMLLLLQQPQNNVFLNLFIQRTRCLFDSLNSKSD